MSTARHYHALIRVTDRIFTFGGKSGINTTASCEFYSLASCKWSNLDPLPFPIAWTTAALYNQEIWVTGREVEKMTAFNLSNSRFRVVNITLGHDFFRLMIVQGSDLYIMRAGSKDIIKLTGDEVSMTTLAEKSKHFMYVRSTIAYIGSNVYFVDEIGDLYEFDTNTEKLIKKEVDTFKLLGK